MDNSFSIGINCNPHTIKLKISVTLFFYYFFQASICLIVLRIMLTVFPTISQWTKADNRSRQIRIFMHTLLSCN